MLGVTGACADVGLTAGPTGAAAGGGGGGGGCAAVEAESAVAPSPFAAAYVLRCGTYFCGCH